MIDQVYGLVHSFPFVALIIGFAALIWSADRFVHASAAAAKNLGVSKIIIGLTFVAVGTSAPEIVVGIQDSLHDGGRVAIGNAIGSNIANIGLVLGITALVRPLPFAQTTLRREIPWLIGATLLALICLADRDLTVVDAFILLGGLAFVLYRLARLGRRAGGLPENIQSELDELPDMTLVIAGLWFLAALVVLLVSAHLVVEGAKEVALRFNVSEVVVGLTVVAVGTSLPELSVTVTAVLRGHADMAIGNVVGSNILNLLAVLAIPALMAPQEIDVPVLWRDYGMMLALTALLILFAYGIGSRKIITRFEGFVLVTGWVGYIYLVYHG